MTTAMTEEDARQKWCPFVRWDAWDACGRESAPAANRHGNADDPVVTAIAAYRCIASECMAWRWCDPEQQFTWTTGDPPSGAGWTVNGEKRPGLNTRWERPFSDRRGYCGLAGAPTP